MGSESLTREMLSAIFWGDVNAVDEFLRSGIDIDAADRLGWTALTHALRLKRLDVADLLRRRGAQVGFADSVFLGDAPAVRQALESGRERPSPEELDELLRSTAVRGHSESLRLLLSEPACVSDLSALKFAIHLAAETRHVDSVRILLDAAAGRGDLVPQLTRNAFAAAAAAGRAEILAYLFDHHADHFHPDGRLLRSAAFGDHANVIPLLLDHGCNIDDQSSEDGTTALMLAAQNGGHIKSLGILLKAGARVDLRDASGRTALMFAAQWGSMDCVSRLLEQGADPREEDHEGWNTLAHACRCMKDLCGDWLDHSTHPVGMTGGGNDSLHRGVVRLLHEAGAPNESARPVGLLVAARLGDTRRVELGLAEGIDPNRVYNGQAPLHEAAAEGHLEAVQLLLDGGAEIDRADSDGHTALMLAARRGNPDVVRELVGRGARRDLADRQGNTALSLAEDFEQTSIASFLRGINHPE